MNAAYVVLAIVAALVLAVIVIYNRLVTLRNRFKNAFSQIDVQLKRRYDLIPNLVETAKGYMSHERETLEAVIQARNQAMPAAEKASANPGDAGALKGLMGAEALLGTAMGRFFALAESYPELKADQTMARLMEELTSTENRIGFARQAFNDSVTEYNTAGESFPANMVAAFFAFKAAELLQLDEPRAKEAPKVTF